VNTRRRKVWLAMLLFSSSASNERKKNNKKIDIFEFDCACLHTPTSQTFNLPTHPVTRYTTESADNAGAHILQKSCCSQAESRWPSKS
jgi:hypothetical protein